MNDWSLAYLEAQKRLEQRVGSLEITSLDRRIINTWVRVAITRDEAPDPTAIYFGLFDALPPQNAIKIKKADSVVHFIEAIREEKGLPLLTNKESDQIQLLAVEVFICCSALQNKQNTPSANSGCVGLILVIGFMLAGISYISMFIFSHVG